MNQKEVWDAIAERWSEFRQTPSPTVVDFLKDKKGKILDLGCGSGRNFIKLRKGKIYGLDFSEKMIELAKKDAKKKKIDVELKVMGKKIPYEKEFFDSAICIAVLHCLKPKEQKVMIKELHRVLKKKATALISVWGRKSPRLKNAKKESYVGWKTGETKQLRYTYIYDLIELQNQLEDAGFKVKRIWEERNINVIVEKS
jgi:ubiquinone/menaquinone biosynthesis C-methylase UbiE